MTKSQLTKLERIKADGKFINISDTSDPTSIKEYVFKKYDDRNETYHGAKPGEVFFSGYCYPIDTKVYWREVLTERAKLKKLYDDSMNLVYQLTNEIIRGEK